MKLSQLIDLLSSADPDMPVCFYDEPSGTEVPVEIESVIAGSSEDYMTGHMMEDGDYEVVHGRVILLGR